MSWKEYLNKYRKDKNFNPNEWVKNKCNKFNNYLKEHNITGAVVSVSGGVDSGCILALLKYTLDLPNSNLKKIYAVNQPISSSDWALDRSNELCNSLNIELIVIDQTSIHNSLVNEVKTQLNYEGNLFSQGQLKSYMRTPVNYYLAQLLNEQGYKSIVIGTGNKDEDGYLAYYCKYGDGAIDVQLISDLHKSEVFIVGKYLNIPDSILLAPPSADLWSGQEDEKELGFSYDFVEFFTGYYMNLNENEKQYFLEDSEFIVNKKLCESIHKRNCHKINGVINL
jgi:NAD+ synthase (glutamine-hydrolysing)